MSNKDIKKGIAIQANADAAKVEKLSRGLNAHKAALDSLQSGQSEIRDAMGIVLDDMSAGEAKMLYDLQIKKTADELDETEKRVLCAAIYTLLSQYGQDVSDQKLFYANLEKYLGVSERKDDFDFYLLSNVDSHTDRIVILKALCSFLFLQDGSFSFLREREEFAWLFSFAPVTDIINVCSVINQEQALLGTTGIINKYDPLLSAAEKQEEEYYLSAYQDDEDSLEENISDNEYEYDELVSLVNKYLSDESAFGKGTAFSEEDLRKELPKKYEKIGFDAFIAASRIEKGFLIFTTYALYIKAGGILKNEYVAIPYQNIDIEGMMTSAGRRAGTRKLTIPVVIDSQILKYDIDDSKLLEEKLRDLLVEIKNKNVFSETDQTVGIEQLSPEVKEKLISSFVYALNQEHMPLADVLVLSKDYGIGQRWNSYAKAVTSDEDFSRAVSFIIASSPYPSKKAVSLSSMELLMGLVSHANQLTGKPSSLLTQKQEQYLRSFDQSDISSKEFNLLMKKNSQLIKELDYEEYISLRDSIDSEAAFRDQIKDDLELIISKIESGLDFKTKKTIKKGAENVVKAAKSAADGAADLAQKAQKDTAEFIDKFKKH